MIHLYGMGSPNVVKVVLMLEETASPWRFSFVDVFSGEQFTPAFQALNANGKVPVIVDETDPAAPVTLSESGAILIHLAEQRPDLQLLPREGPSRAATLQWLMFQMAGFGPTSGQAIHFRYMTDRDGYGRDRFSHELQRLTRVVDDQLGKHAHIAGPAYSIADVALLPWVNTLRRFFPEFVERPNIERWSAELMTRPAMVKTHAFFDQMSAQGRQALRSASPEALDRYYGRTPPELP
jgi:GST-like protein